MLLELLFSVENSLVSLILEVDSFPSNFICFFVSFSILNHFLNICVRETTTWSNCNGLSFARGLVFGRNVQYTVSINIEGNFDLWMSSWSHWNSSKLKISKLFVVSSHFSLSLKNCDSDFSLVVSSSWENLRFLGWNSCVSVNKFSENSTHGLYTKGKRSNIEQKHVFDITCQHSSLDSCSDSNCLIWVDTLIWSLSEELFDTVLNLWHSGLSSNQEHLVDFIFGKTRVLQTSVEWLQGSSHKVWDNSFELCSRYL